MKTFFLVAGAVLAAGLAACHTAPETPATSTEPLTDAQQQALAMQLPLAYAEPVQIDSSAYVLYPLVLDNTQQEERDSYGSKSSYEAVRYWNLAFYDPTTGAAHLLDSTRRMAIYGYESRPASTAPATVSAAVFAQYRRGSFQRVDKLLYYSVRTLDYNRDGDLTPEDPNYLFISDKAGRGFRQISPANHHVVNWQLLPATHQILLHTLTDSNQNRQFDREDVTVALVYDLATGGPARPVFSPQFQSRLQQVRHAQWPKPPKP